MARGGAETGALQVAFLPAVSPPPPVAGDEGSAVIDAVVWLAVRKEYGRLRASPGRIAAALAALESDLSGGLLAKRRIDARPQVRQLDVVKPRKLRHRKARRRLLERIRGPR